MTHTVRFHPNAASFYDAVSGFLLSAEAENSTAIGVTLRCIEGHRYGDGTEDDWFASVHGGDESVQMVIFRTPPIYPGISHGSAAACEAALDAMTSRGLDLPGLIGPKEAVETMARVVKERDGRDIEVQMDQALFRLDEVTPGRRAAGKMRLAEPSDEPLIRRWSHRFMIDCHMLPPDSAPPARVPALEGSRLVLWCDDAGVPVSMAASTRETPRGKCVGSVYTPDELRGNGYATTLVAELSQQYLDEGSEFCFLFTDLANPTSNQIYPAIGYRRIDDFLRARFHDASDSAAS